VERMTLGFHILERRADEQPEYRIPFHNSPAPPMAAASSKVRLQLRSSAGSCFSLSRTVSWRLLAVPKISAAVTASLCAASCAEIGTPSDAYGLTRNVLIFLSGD
jgi:hypothetical protein